MSIPELLSSAARGELPTWAVAGRLCRRSLLALVLVWLVALVAWPERHTPWVSEITGQSSYGRDENGNLRWFPGMPTCRRDASLRVLVDAITE